MYLGSQAKGGHKGCQPANCIKEVVAVLVVVGSSGRSNSRSNISGSSSGSSL